MTSPQRDDAPQIAPGEIWDTARTAATVGVSVKYLKTMRWRGQGPRWTSLGDRTVIYYAADVVEWVRERDQKASA